MVFFVAALALAAGLAACEKRGKSPVKSAAIAVAVACGTPAQCTWNWAGSSS